MFLLHGDSSNPVRSRNSEATFYLERKSQQENLRPKNPHAELIQLGLSLIEAKHLDELKEKSLSEKDRLSLAHEEYQKTNGKITLDQFIGKLIRKEV
ncbi:MAG: hypothetical protein J7501_17175 [Bdellovibrio sp.]|nr:hypothetical protein [Bdellovibrio sp.]